MVKAVWNGRTIADSNDTVMVEGNHYFPRGSVDASALGESDTVTHCAWKGEARYHSLLVDGETNPDAAWYYADPNPAAGEIRDCLAFWKGVEVG